MEISNFIIWYIYQLILGVIGLPIANYFFGKWKDKGYAFAKVIGIMVIGIPVWFFSSLKILPFNTQTAYISMLIGFFVSLYFIVKMKIKINKYMIVEELLFLITLIVWAFIRSTNPRAEGTEKVMNVAFMNSIDRTTYFPPKDPWFSGSNINYYYMGHYFITFISKLTGIKISFAYNFALITIIAQTCLSLFSISVNSFSQKVSFYKRVLIGFLAAIFISFAGNLHYIVSYLEDLFNPTPFSYYFPNSTRIITNTINEFPSYSIILGDVHPHYMSLPYILLAIALSLASFKIPIASEKKILFNIFISPFIVCLYAINSWDLITIFFIFSIIHLYQAVTSKERNIIKLKHFVLSELTIILPGLLLMIPYLINFSPAVGGIGFVPKYRDWGIDVLKSDFKAWLLMWGGFFIIFLLFLSAKFGKVFNDKKLELENWIYIIVFAGFALIIGVEIFFLRDIFVETNEPYFRTNTVFKFYYHAWLLLGIGFAFFINNFFFNVKPSLQIKKFILVFVTILVFFGSFTYLFKSISDYYCNGPFDKTITSSNPIKLLERCIKTPKTLDGNNYIKKEYPGDFEAINWINSNIEGQPIFAEAVGEAYTYYARVSANTGVLTVVGWPTHEWQWRGDATLPFRRSDDIRALYESQTPEEANEIIQKYEIDYIYLGELENQKYPNINKENITSLGDLVYENLNTSIYKINK